MILLGLDTSHSEGSLCLQRDSQILELLDWKQEKSHAELIAGFLDKSLKKHKLTPKDINGYAVNIGPGSFTGIRIGINTIKTLAFVSHKPIFTFNSLETIAQSASQDKKNLIVAINAHSELCYVGKFVSHDDKWKALGDIEVLPAIQLNDLLKTPETIFAGDAFEVYKDKITNPVLKPNAFQDIPSAKFLNELAQHKNAKSISWEALETFYVRLSSPEEKAHQKK